MDGRTVNPSDLGLRPDLCQALHAWNAEYDDSKLPFEAKDHDWLSRGKELLADVRAELRDANVIVTEPWWEEEPSDSPRIADDED